ncbi:MAG: ATP-dependent helicase [Bacteroidetes bacterium]|nr:MAG: ATP-dependent helicase [Bacteroidota bacterium]
MKYILRLDYEYFCQKLKRNILSNFEELGIPKDFVKGLNDLNIFTPTEIQAKVIPLLLNKNTDLVGQAQTGTGKTAAYGLPLLYRMNPTSRKVQGLVLCPTRELGQQVAKQLFRFTKYTDKIFTEAVYGGAHIENQIVALKRPTQVVVATPGRLIDLVKKKAVDLSNVKIVVLDEADEMLSMGFKKELDEILSFLSDAKNKWLFSATIPKGISQIVNEHLSQDAIKIVVGKSDVMNKNIEHQFVISTEGEKLRMLNLFLKSQKSNRGMVFCKTKNDAKKLAKQLISRNIAADAIHGDLMQKERDKVMRAFKNEKLKVLVATDIAARGIDVDSLGFVAHYQLPEKKEYYTHRSGRTARAGKKGISMCIITKSDMGQIRYFEKELGIRFEMIK